MNTFILRKFWYGDFIKETKNIFGISFPIMFCKVGFMSMGIVDAAMLGKLGINELAASGVARSFFLPLSVFFMGILFSIDVFSSHALGANRKKDIEKIFFSGMQMALFLSALFFLLTLILSFAIPFLDFEQHIIECAKKYLFYLSFGTPFLIFNLAIQRFLLAQKIITPFIVIIVASNIVNYYLNKALIFGEYGFSASGIIGAAHATNISRIFVFAACVGLCAYYFLVIEKGLLHIKNLFAFDKKAILKMFCFGIPGGGQRVLEIALFSLLTLFSAQLTVSETAAHHVAMIILNFCHNFPLALSSTAILRIGGLIGNGQNEKAKYSGYCTIFWGTTFMIAISSTLFFMPVSVLSIFTTDPMAIISGEKIAWLLGCCLILDGFQGCAIGALRGAGDNKLSFYASIIGYYPIALVLAYLLCFYLKLGISGLWCGLLFGFAAVSFIVISHWITFKPKLILISNEGDQE
ncbi:MAG: MATE family efflux transporter [Myxococcales bacterium]|nr:MATE family efflux transporter [Myxococcales bacterium]USN50206.1 MAG: MATE family efflux transporter [Myxococcales bacterium]